MHDESIQKTILDSLFKDLPRAKEGNIGKYKSKIDFFQKILTKYKPKICAQTGFNAGHSAAVILNYCPIDSKLFSFDIGRWNTEKDANSIIDIYFPNRHFYIEGDSKRTLPAFGIELDFAFIDGGHDYRTCLSDIINFDRVIKKNGIILIDDVDTQHGIPKAIQQFGFKNYTKLDTSEFGDYPNGVRVFQKL